MNLKCRKVELEDRDRQVQMRGRTLGAQSVQRHRRNDGR